MVRRRIPVLLAAAVLWSACSSAEEVRSPTTQAPATVSTTEPTTSATTSGGPAPATTPDDVVPSPTTPTAVRTGFPGYLSFGEDGVTVVRDTAARVVEEPVAWAVDDGAGGVLFESTRPAESVDEPALDPEVRWLPAGADAAVSTGVPASSVVAPTVVDGRPALLTLVPAEQGGLCGTWETNGYFVDELVVVELAPGPQPRPLFCWETFTDQSWWSWSHANSRILVVQVGVTRKIVFGPLLLFDDAGRELPLPATVEPSVDGELTALLSHDAEQVAIRTRPDWCCPEWMELEDWREHTLTVPAELRMVDLSTGDVTYRTRVDAGVEIVDFDGRFMVLSDVGVRSPDLRSLYQRPGSSTTSTVIDTHGLLAPWSIDANVRLLRPNTTDGDAEWSASVPPRLRHGDTGPWVAFAQQQLGFHGLTTSVDGIFGPGTDDDVRTFQARSGLEVDAIVGPDTWAALTDPSFARSAMPQLYVRGLVDGTTVTTESVRLEGASTPGATVRVADGPSTVVRDDGGWDLGVDLDPGWNDLVIEVRDREGGTDRVPLSLYSEPPLSLIGSIVEVRDDEQLWADGAPTGLWVENRTGYFAHSSGERALVRSATESPADPLRGGFDGYAMDLTYADEATGDPYRTYVIVDAIGVHVRPGDGFVAYVGPPKYAGQPVRFGWIDGRLAPLEILSGGTTLDLTIALASEGVGRLVTGPTGVDLSMPNLPELPVRVESVFYRGGHYTIPITGYLVRHDDDPSARSLWLLDEVGWTTSASLYQIVDIDAVDVPPELAQHDLVAMPFASPVVPEPEPHSSQVFAIATEDEQHVISVWRLYEDDRYVELEQAGAVDDEPGVAAGGRR